MVSVPASSRPITASRKKALSQSASMVIIPASLADIVEAVGGVTGIALVDARLRSGCALRDHAEMLHEVTGRRLMRSEEHTSELQSLMRISYAVFCLKKKKQLHATKLQHNN